MFEGASSVVIAGCACRPAVTGDCICWAGCDDALFAEALFVGEFEPSVAEQAAAQELTRRRFGLGDDEPVVTVDPGEIPVGSAVLAAELAAEPAAGVDEGGLVTRIVGFDRIVAWAQALQAEAIAELAARRTPVSADPVVDSGGPDGCSEYLAHELGAMLRLSPSSAYNRLVTATTVATRLPATWVAWRAGLLDLARVLMMIEETRSLSGAQARWVEGCCLGRAGSQTTGQLRRSVRRAVLAVDVTAVAARQERARAERRVVAYPTQDGMADLVATLPVEQARLAYLTLSEIARTAPAGDERSADARRADALVHLISCGGSDQCACCRAAHTGTHHPAVPDSTTRDGAARDGAASDRAASGRAASDGGAPDGAAPDAAVADPGPDTDTGACDGGARDGGAAGSGRHGGAAAPDGSRPWPGTSCTCPAQTTAGSRAAPAAQILVTVAATTLLGLDEEPGDLAGTGPIPAAVARMIAADATWRRLIVAPDTGTVQSLDRLSYRPGKILGEHVRARDIRCRFPTCTRTASYPGIDLDHGIPWPSGPTTADNLTAKCRSHHRLKTHGRWQHEQQPDGTVRWTSPTGHTYDDPLPAPLEPLPPVLKSPL